MSKINVKEYFGGKKSDFDKAQERFAWQLFGFVLTFIVVIRVLDEINIKGIIFGK